ncbi:MAG: hypothetical protein AAFU64_16110, partial [Bacteroidota bacterium]
RLNRWLRSPQPEWQMYGTMGLKALEKQGRILLKPQERKIIFHLQTENKRIFHSGRWGWPKNASLNLSELVSITFNQILETELDLYFPDKQ